MFTLKSILTIKRVAQLSLCDDKSFKEIARLQQSVRYFLGQQGRETFMKEFEQMSRSVN